MFFKSRYILEFSKPKREVLENIEKDIFLSFSNYFGKSFTGKVSENGFKIKLLGGKDSPTFKGNFILNKDNEESFELSVGFEYYEILLYLIFLSFILIFIIKSYDENYYLIPIYLAVLGLIISSRYFQIKKKKSLFFDYLKNFDKDCKITYIK
ncbi:hypothetical protein [Chryseobacterium terrae]|uniref:Uncharacterized protein n=1 Tax=Chryseobacterium terrae TaxID=3163299 RepID=A0ABW8Y1N3_9FLAO